MGAVKNCAVPLLVVDFGLFQQDKGLMVWQRSAVRCSCRIRTHRIERDVDDSVVRYRT